jgi:DNA mismatch endonuclease (patch repair protein)
MSSPRALGVIWKRILADRFSKEERSDIMSRISGKDTKPEILVRRFLFSRGFRYRKNVGSLPGRPDIVLPKYRTVVFAHGCFWHGHKECKYAKLPESRRDFWERKIRDNVCRDERHAEDLRRKGWNVVIVWQCEIITSVKRRSRLESLISEIQGV